MESLAEIWSQMQYSLFPQLRECLEEPLTDKLRQVVSVLELVRIEEHPLMRDYQWIGRKRLDRRPVARAFVVKAVYGLATTEMLIDRLRFDQSLRRICGWERVSQMPSAATFSRAFAEFAAANLGEAVHEALVRQHMAGRLVGHISRDSTEIEAREKPAAKEKQPLKTARKRGRPKRGEVREPPPAKSRLPKQAVQSGEEAFAELPTVCDVGIKRNSKGHSHSWIGYKLHLDVADGGIPITALTTSASLHDSQAAIPMAKRTAGRVVALYELMDAAYDAEAIRQSVDDLGHKAIIDPNPRKTGAVPFDPATAERFKERTTVERAYSRLKDEFGARHVRVRGHPKVHMHLMFGVLALFADQSLKLLHR
jgi:hypothetical protein